MSSLINQVQLIGRLGADAEIKTTNQGTKLGTFSLATNDRIKQSNGEWKEITLWHNCIVWGELNKILEKYGKKGNQFIIHGALNYNEYEDSNSIKRSITEIKVDTLLVLAHTLNKETNTKSS